MTKAGLAIMICEMISIHFLYKKYFGNSGRSLSEITPEEFMSRASLQDIIKMRHHSVNGFLALCIMTMGRLFQ